MVAERHFSLANFWVLLTMAVPDTQSASIEPLDRPGSYWYLICHEVNILFSPGGSSNTSSQIWLQILVFSPWMLLYCQHHYLKTYRVPLYPRKHNLRLWGPVYRGGVLTRISLKSASLNIYIVKYEKKCISLKHPTGPVSPLPLIFYTTARFFF